MAAVAQNINDNLFNAIARDDVETVKNLLNAGADILDEYEASKYPNILNDILVENKFKEIVIGKPNALHLACALGRTQIVSLLLEKNSGIYKKCSLNNWTPLHWAAEYGYTHIADFLLMAGANIDAARNDGGTPLHIAAFHGHLAMIRFLIQKKANLEAKARLGGASFDKTPLYWAVVRNHTEAVELLMSGGARPDPDGNMICWANEHYAYRIADMLSSYREGKQNLNFIESNSSNSIEQSDSIFVIPFDNIELGENLGKGSCGTVYKGKWTGSRKEIAIKKLNPMQSYNENLIREAKMMIGSSHPNIVVFYGVVLTPEKYIVMEYLSKGSLYDFLHGRKDSIDLSRCYQIYIDIANGLAYLHKKNPPILHRDLKSLNILLDEDFAAKLADFGLATILQPISGSSYDKASNRGTEAWRAPEIRSSYAPREYTSAADVYSFGVVLWEVQSRKTPYKDMPVKINDDVCSSGEKTEILLEKKIMSKSDMLKSIPDAPKPIYDLIEKCLNKSPEDRPKMHAVTLQLSHNAQCFLKNPCREEKKEEDSQKAQNISFSSIL